MLIERLKKKNTKENLWLFILALVDKEPIYAYDVRAKIQKRFGFWIGNVTAYIVLYKLKTTGHVADEWVLTAGRQRRYYNITVKGKKQLKNGIAYLKEILDLLESG